MVLLAEFAMFVGRGALEYVNSSSLYVSSPHSLPASILDASAELESLNILSAIELAALSELADEEALLTGFDVTTVGFGLQPDRTSKTIEIIKIITVRLLYVILFFAPEIIEYCSFIIIYGPFCPSDVFSSKRAFVIFWFNIIFYKRDAIF